MRSGRSNRADAITNSPFVRALIRPVVTRIEPPAPFPAPSPSDLISTQPLPLKVVLNPGGMSDWVVAAPSIIDKGKKRERSVEEEQFEDIREDFVPNGAAVEVSYTAENLPPELAKYWFQRHRLFTLYDEGCQMDLEGWYSVTPELIATQIAERCRSGTVVDAFCGVGGNSIQFAFTCEHVIAIDTSPVRLACAKHNAEIYGVADRITFILGDFIQWSQNYVEKKSRGEIKKAEEVEVVFLSPPWGGIEYKELGTPIKSTSTEPAEPISYPLSALAPIHGAKLFGLARAITHNVAYYLPKNMDLLEISTLPIQYPMTGKEGEELGGRPEKIEVEEEWMGNKLKAITCYFGELAHEWKD